jgi:hypothetical protein
MAVRCWPKLFFSFLPYSLPPRPRKARKIADKQCNYNFGRDNLCYCHKIKLNSVTVFFSQE